MIKELKPEDFTVFFQDIHGYEPFPWQQRLTMEVLTRGSWPNVIDLPTGSGKTAVLDTAVFALAFCPKIFPRRIIFVIDRRIIVDQVFKRAEKIRHSIKCINTPVLVLVRERLELLSGGNNLLGVAALRGGIPIDNKWTRNADQPWVMVSTVDQFGSRLLFRGYGASSGMRPIHAGLAGNDCLVFLDEVHLSLPFAETLSQVTELKSSILPQRFTVVEMSATPSDRNSERFSLDAVADIDKCEELRRRVRAAKKAKLVSARNSEAIPDSVLKIIKSYQKSDSGEKMGTLCVIVNRVRTARNIYQLLKTSGYTTFLITGRMRPLDSANILNKIGPVVDPDRDIDKSEYTVVVATQAIEVGADFSFDALITECAAVDSLRQRFGRLDRRGLRFSKTGLPTRAWIIGLGSVVNSKKPDPIYGNSIRTTWEELKKREKDGFVDVGPLDLKNFSDEATAPKIQAPLLLKTHMDAWVQTSPEPITQPSIDQFLHGIDNLHDPDVSILWRQDRSKEVLHLVPPRQAEFLKIPVYAVRAWLSNNQEEDIADISSSEPKNSEFDKSRDFTLWKWKGFDKDPETVRDIKDIHPGDILVLDPEYGGLTEGTWDPSSKEKVVDLGDVAQIESGAKATLRLDSRLISDVSQPLPKDEAEAHSSNKERISEWLKRSAENDDQPEWMRKIIEKFNSSEFDIQTIGLEDRDDVNSYYVLTELHNKKPPVDIEIMDESDAYGSLTGTKVMLDDHMEKVGKQAESTARRLGFSDEIAEDLRLAGQLHDLGKVDRRFQAQLIGGDPVDIEMLEKPLAKSLPGIRRTQEYPRGMRHEVASVALVQSNHEILKKAHDKDLVLHLIATHHGWGRPLLPVIEDPEPQMLDYVVDGVFVKTKSDFTNTTLALEMSDRFWKLVERYGYYGLAWLETVLRLSDHQQSSREEN